MRDIIITSSVLITAIFLIRFFTKGKIHPALQYALWLPVAVRLLLPVPLWSSGFGVLNYLPDGMAGYQASSESESALRQQNGTETDRSGAGINTSDTETAKDASGTVAKDTEIDGKSIDADADAGGDATKTDISGTDADSGINTDRHTAIDSKLSGQSVPEESWAAAFFTAAHVKRLVAILRIVWIAGMILCGGYMLFYQIKWEWYLHHNRKPLKGMKQYHGLFVYTVKGLPSPCLCGRNIYLTKEMAADEKRLQHILVHEYCHYRQGDLLWVVVRCVLIVVYWFHPLAWAAAYASKQDSELACDEAAIRLLGEEERIAYGRTLLRLIAGAGWERNRIGFASTMSGGEKGIRERICRIAAKRNYAALAAAVVVLLAVGAVLITFSGKKDDASGRNNTQNTDESILADSAPQDLAQTADGTDIEEQLKDRQAQLDIQARLDALEQELQKEEEAEQELAAKAQAEAEFAAVLKMLAVYDETKMLDDYVQAYYAEGENALEEGIYLLEKMEGADGVDISVYGMYTKEYGCRGVKILIGDDAADFDETWLVSGMHGWDENIRVYEKTQDNRARTFAVKMIVENTSDTEVWNLYLCDRHDTGTVEMYQVEAQSYMEQINERLRFSMESKADKSPVIAVYDNGERIGEIDAAGFVADASTVKGVFLNPSMVGWELGADEDDLKLLIAAGIRFDNTDELWYRGLPLISFQVSCGQFGERKISLGEAVIETDHLNPIIQDDIQNQTDAVLVSDAAYCNPCPSYTRISDTFGERINPITNEVRKHNGVDLAAEAGADIVAAADGVVYQTGYDAENGNYVIVYHAQNGEYTHYAACQDILVVKGENVTAGQRIATVGSTGRSTGAHLHFAVSKDEAGEYIEPVFE
ncbi:MAG: M23/M56 family metallopeptidase [Bacillus sp. (in: Bacteria)]|nr:M23/M56 family metallopeptidase [Bacillus sp. (in: firmicutes)]MCM1426336.1 M23/M56 family metallopeptidase [Eubacterium sp.]